MTRRQRRMGGNDWRKEGGEEGHKRRWTASRRASGSGGGWRTVRGTPPKDQGASRAEDENERRVRGGRHESARPTRP